MNQPTAKKRFPAWLRSLGWLGFALLGMATFLLVARWWLADRSHQTALALVKQGGALSKSSSKKPVAASSAQKESSTSRGTPIAELSVVGIYLGDDLAAQKELQKQLDEMLATLRKADYHVDGVLSFRAMLVKMGMAVPETMTEAEAAAEFLKWAERFSAILAQWREAVGKGPWDFSSVETKDGYAVGNKVFRVAYPLQCLLGVMAEARLRTGDTAAAWSDLQAMNSSGIRCGEVRGSFQGDLTWRMFRAARSGMELGGWTDGQLMEISTMMSEQNALASAHRDIDLYKLEMADSFARFREPQSGIAGSFVDSARSSVGQMLNRIGVAMTTDQQIADNLAVINFQMDQPLTRFDPDTGVYLGESAGASIELPHSKPDDVSFDQFYYMYSELYGWRYDGLPDQIIKYQSTVDQTRIAAALEIQRRAMGEYPATLEAVSGTLGGSTPIDIATGQPYFYQRNVDGGYTLWGTGIDGKSDGGNERTDVTWKHRPIKGK